MGLWVCWNKKLVFFWNIDFWKKYRNFVQSLSLLWFAPPLKLTIFKFNFQQLISSSLSCLVAICQEFVGLMLEYNKTTTTTSTMTCTLSNDGSNQDACIQLFQHPTSLSLFLSLSVYSVFFDQIGTILTFVCSTSF